MSEPISEPVQWPVLPQGVESLDVASPDAVNHLSLLPQGQGDWPGRMLDSWHVGEDAGQQRLKAFVDEQAVHYHQLRDAPHTLGTSRLSPHLHFGEVSARQCVQAATDRHGAVDAMDTGAQTFIKEVVWREFGYHLLHWFPQTIDKPLDARFERFEWRDEASELRAWQQGATGIPIVDAGMRELYATGWMHNRVRMIVASFLVKNLLMPWQQGEAWFRDTLVDADLASNTLGWQWAAGCGADAAPFFRIFNPVLQGEKFDAQGDYVRRWVPELSEVPNKFLHKPWDLPEAERQELAYPPPLVDLRSSRQRALDAFDAIKDHKR